MTGILTHDEIFARIRPHLLDLSDTEITLPEQILLSHSLLELGIDSLFASELELRLDHEFELPLFSIDKNADCSPTVEDIVKSIQSMLTIQVENSNSSTTT